MSNFLPNDAESRDKRRDRIYKPLAAVAGAMLVVGGYNLATTPREVDHDHAVISNSADAAETVCTTVAKLAERNGVQVDTKECLNDIDNVTLENGQVIDVTLTKTPVAGIGNDSLGFNVPSFFTSVDHEIEHTRR